MVRTGWDGQGMIGCPKADDSVVLTATGVRDAGVVEVVVEGVCSKSV